jgi:hypothetical protein
MSAACKTSRKNVEPARDGLYQSAFRVGAFPGRIFQFAVRRLCASKFRQCPNKESLGAEGIKVVRRRIAATLRIPSDGTLAKRLNYIGVCVYRY